MGSYKVDFKRIFKTIAQKSQMQKIYNLKKNL